MVEEFGTVVLMILRIASGTLDLGDLMLQLVAIETVAHIGATPEGKLALGKFSKFMVFQNVVVTVVVNRNIFI